MDVVDIRVPEEAPCTCTRPVFRIPATADAEQIGHIRSHARAVLVFGPDASATDVTTSLDTIAREAPRTACSAIALAARESLPDFQQLVDDDRLFYLAGGALSPRDLDALIDGALGERQLTATTNRLLSASVVRRIALAQSVAELADALRAAASAKIIDATRTRCVLFDREQQMLWIPNESAGESMSAGVVGFIVRTGSTVCLTHLDGDARFDRDLDDPEGDGGDRFLGVPIRADGAVVAVLVAIRAAYAPPFEPLAVAAMEAIAAHASPYAAAWLGDAPDSDGLYRPRALRATEPLAENAEPLRLDGAWMRRATWLFIATLIALILGLVAFKEWLA